MGRASKFMPLKFAASAFIAVSFIFGCGGDYDFTPEEDLQALNRIQKIWTTEINGTPFTISFCENHTLNQKLVDRGEDCMLDHVVRSQNSKSGHHHEGPSCADSGCMNQVVTIVTAKVTNASGETLNTDSEVNLGGYNDPYGGDYGVELGGGSYVITEDSPWSGHYIYATIKENGSLIIDARLLTYLGYDPQSSGYEVTIEAPVGDAECPAPEDSSDSDDGE